MKKILVVLVSVVCSLMSQAQKPWTLNDCISYALEHNIQLQQRHIAAQSSREDLQQAKEALFPSLSFMSSHNYGYQPWPNTGQSIVTGSEVQFNTQKGAYNGSYNISANWTVFDGGRRMNTIKQDRLQEEQSMLDSIQTANSIQEQIAQLYVQALYSADAIRVCQEQLNTALKNEERGQAMVEIGKLSKADLAQLTAQRAQDDYNLVQAQNNRRKYVLQLKQLLEITDGDFDIAEPSGNADVLELIPSLQDVYQAALAQRPEIRQQKLAMQKADLQVESARTGYMPQVNLNAGVTTSTNSRNTNEWGTQIKNNVNMSVGASVNVPLYDQRQTKTAIRKAKLQKINSELAMQDQQKQLYRTIETYWLDANTYQQQYRSATASVESSQQSYELLQEQFRLGLKNIIELMNGKQNLLNAQQQQLQAKYQAILNRQLLLFYQNGIVEE